MRCASLSRTLLAVLLGLTIPALTACSDDADPTPDAATPDAAVQLDAAPDAATPDAAVSPDASIECGTPLDERPLLELTWIEVPAGSYDMGCVSGDIDCYSAESPLHSVTLPAFDITETEVTQHQYESHTGENPSAFPGCPNCPAEYVDWDDAKAFCIAMGGRLPSEAEWEYAAHAGNATIYGCGDDPACLEDRAWYYPNSCNRTHPAALKDPNAFGLYDMQGNVWEWVEDCWHSDYSDSPPTDGSVWSGGDCSYRVLRGGAYGVNARGLRVSNRDGDYVDGYLVPSPGFRCVRDATEIP